VTDDDLFKMLNRAEEMSLENWRVYRALYNAELGKFAGRIEELELVLKEAQMQLHSEKLLRNDLEETFSIRSQKQYQRIERLEKLFLLALKLRAKQKVYLKTESEEDLIALKKAEEIFDEIAIPAWDSRERKMGDNLWSKLEEQRIRRRNTVDLLTRLEELCGDDGDLAGRDLYDDDVVDAIARIKELQAALREIIVHCEVPAPPNAEALKMFARAALEKKDDEGEKRND